MRRTVLVPTVPLLLTAALALGGCSSSGGGSTPASVPSDASNPADAGTGGGSGNGSVLPRGFAAALPAVGSVKLTFSRRSAAFDQPVQVTSAVDRSSRLFVVEKTGRVRVYLGKGKVQAKPYLDLRSRALVDSGERGLLSVAFSPRFPTTHQLWAAYVAKSGALQVSRFTATSASARSVRASTERKVITVPHPTFANHNGGMLAFGRDGDLYIGTGDGGSGGDPRGNAQNRRSLLGKILRIDVTRSCGSKAYCVPRSNPYATSSSARHEIWAVGVRNPWRFSVDPRTGDLWIGDVGQNKYEEIDRIPAGKGGRDLGWPCREGKHPFEPSRCAAGTTLQGPVVDYSHALGYAVIGGSVYRGSRYASLLAGRYVYADFGSGRVWVRGAGGGVRRVGMLPNVTGFGTSSGGEVWAVTLDGGLYAMKASRA